MREKANDGDLSRYGDRKQEGGFEKSGKLKIIAFLICPVCYLRLYGWLDDIPECTFSIGRRFYPRLYKRYKDLRDYNEAAEWSRTLDWQNNPYDRFLLKREILRHLESELYYRGPQNVFTFASRHEIEEEVEQSMDDYTKKNFKNIDVIGFVIVSIPWRLGFKHGRVEHSRLVAAVAQTSGR